MRRAEAEAEAEAEKTNNQSVEMRLRAETRCFISTNNPSRRNRYDTEIVKDNWAHFAINAALRRDRTEGTQQNASYHKSRQIQAFGCCSVSRSKARAFIEESLLFSAPVGGHRSCRAARYRNAL